ncbi:MAG: NUDIX domain-containing protein [Clostridia bacterium]|nr:NUDIX domain-containing protein [Clostridia bacterium]
MNKFDEQEFKILCKTFNTNAEVKEVEIIVEDKAFFDKTRENIIKDRRGEVVFCVIRPNGRIITITCEEYPQGVYRIPTGGLGHREDVVHAVKREVMEELGLTVDVKKFLGVIKIRFLYDKEHIMFYSYMFLLKEVGGRLLIDALEDEVSDIREVNCNQLYEMAESLLDIGGKWKDWGKFRYVSTMAVYEKLQMTEEKRV